MLGMDEAETLRAQLRAAGVADVRIDGTSRAVYSSDASLYRVTPTAVVCPADHDEVAAVLEVCRRQNVPVTARGGGTSIAGNAVGAGVVMDFSRYMNKVLSVDPDTRTAVVQPGVVQSVLQKAAAPFGLRFGPDPSSLSRCTIGGMIGNNACGSRALGYGRTSDNVTAMRVLTARGEDLRLPSAQSPTLDALSSVIGAGLATIRTEFGTFGRQVSGYSLEHLLPENGFDVTKLLVGSEGTLAVCTEATVNLVHEPAHRMLVVLGYPDIAAAGDATPAILAHRPTACEGIDSRIVDVVRERKGDGAVPPLPAGAAWVFVEVVGDTVEEALRRAEETGSSCGAVDSLVVEDPVRAATLWQIRTDGAGLAARSPQNRPAHAGWEDAAVPPARLGDYLRDFDALMADFGVTGMPYGHFGEGCMHVRIDLPLDRPGGRKVFRDFMFAAAELVAGYGGSLSGEHGDGRARGELLPLMYSSDALALLAAVKHTFDPDNLLNPGVVVDPLPLDADLRVPAAPALRRDLALAYRHDGGDFTQAVHRCTGVGKCRADNTGSGGVMCPSYQATREEKDSTRGRARVLQEMINGTDVRGGWRSPEVHEALDLCLSCKGCASDCPTGVDMAAYKAEVLHQSYRGRIRPASHYSLGWLPRWAKMAAVAPKLANAAMKVPGVGSAALAVAGVDHRRTIPAFAPQTFRSWFKGNVPAGGPGDEVLLFVDTFTNYFSPEVGIATVRVLQDAGYRPRLTERQECCGLTWISTGQLDTARRKLDRTLAALAPSVDRGVPVVGMEPSCTAVLRSEAVELVGGARAEAVGAATRTLAELLTATGWQPPSMAGTEVVAQPHCHHHSVMGWSPDAELLRDAGAELTRLGGCCGLAGNFGVEQGHYEVSVAVAEQQLLPAVRAASAEAVVLADGFSCRTQLDDLTDRHGTHLAQLLAERLPDRV
ncbi:FAD-binding oxidoreductase [Mycobacterium sp. MS1601]|uniref:FAD-binding and (Fe-S)-binding domain-containing protein n=1 Tax=Mycobacterium sp. MS1601 TaxID=1936029 RepID=UPI0009795822|nr:FAD-binding and (Fe-S)-binding domain-containing protein [Mycobacterium sp. MS1601]AQA03751.1 FAD-binding oxidoreductase [Mycobacterium sp. MS1601]